MTPRNDFEREMIEFMARVDEHMQAQTARCNSHAKDISALDDRATSLEGSRTYAKGIIKAVGVGVPAMGSVAWFIFEAAKFIKGAK